MDNSTDIWVTGASTERKDDTDNGDMIETTLASTTMCIGGVGIFLNCLILVVVLQKTLRKTNIGVYMSVLGFLDIVTFADVPG